MGKAKKSTKKFLAKKNSGRKLFHKKPEWKRRKGDVDGAPEGSDDEPQTITKNVADMDVDEFLAGAFLGQDGASDSDADERGSDDDASEDDDELGAAGSDSEDEEEEVGDDLTGGDEIEKEPESDSDDDDDSDGGDVGKQTRRLKDEVSSHRAQLEKLKEADPEFYEYLASTDRELLAFGEGESEEGSESEGEEGPESDEEQQDDEAGARGVEASPAALPEQTLTLVQVESWCRAAKETAALGALRNLLRAYRVACHYGDTEEQVDEGMRIGSSAVYNQLMLFVLKESDGIFREILGVDAAADAAAVGKAPRWRKAEPLVKSFLGNTLHLLGQTTDPAMLAFILRRVRASVVFLAPFSKLQRRFLKAALQVFGSAEDSPRVQAILLVRAMALALPPPAIDACLKGVYRAFSANAKFVNAASAPHINFMASCIVEMYGLDAGAAYQHAFGFIRQLAVLLRQALTSKEKESYREVYCWQTINCLELWANVLAAHADMPELRPLVYPVAQLLLGAARLVPTPAYFPLRLRCVRALNRLAQAAGVFVPVAPLLLEILQWRDLARAPKPAPGDKPPEVLLQLRVGKSAMRSGAYQEEIVEQVMELLAAHLAQWSCHVAFPELAHLPMAQLRRFAKATSVERFRRSARQLADAIERNVAFVGRARDQVDFSPKDLGQVAAFLSAEAAAGSAPVAQHSATLQDRARQRLAMRSAKEVEIGAQLPGSTKVQLDKGRDESDDDMEEPSGDLLPYSKKEKKQQKGDKAGNKKRQRAEEPSDSDTEKEQEMPRGKRGGGKAQKGRQSTAAADALTGGAGDDDWEDREDDVGVYELSDDDDSDGEGAAPVPVAAKGKGKAPPGRKDAKSKTGKGREKSGVNGGGSEKRGKGGKPKEKTGRR